MLLNVTVVEPPLDVKVETLRALPTGLTLADPTHDATNPCLVFVNEALDEPEIVVDERALERPTKLVLVRASTRS